MAAGEFPEPHQMMMTWAGDCTFARLPRRTPGVRADLAVIGVPYDLGVTNRPGSRFGPRAIREQSTLSGEFGDALWPWTEGIVGDLVCVDAGDIAFRPGTTDGMLDATRATVSALLADGTGVVSLGGDHLVSLPLLQAHHEHHGQMALVHFDAHCDTWEYDESHPLHHGMMFLKAARDGLVDPARSVQIGMRTPNDTMGFNVFDMLRHARRAGGRGADVAGDLLRRRALLVHRRRDDRGDVLDLDAVLESQVAALAQDPHHLVSVAGSLDAPVDRSVQVRRGEQHVVDLLACGRKVGIGARRVRDQDARVAHEALLIDELTEDAVPGPAEVDVVVCDLRVRGRRARQQKEAGG